MNIRIKVDSRNLPKGRTNWKRLKGVTDEEIEAAARSDPDNPPLSDAELKRMKRVSEVKALRFRLGMSQEKFAQTFQLSLTAVRDWELHRSKPDLAARSFLKVIAANPKAVITALAAAR